MVGRCQLSWKYLLNLEMIVCLKLTFPTCEHPAGQNAVFLQWQILGGCIDFGPLSPSPTMFTLLSWILTWTQVSHYKLPLWPRTGCITAHSHSCWGLASRLHAPLEPSAEISPANLGCRCSWSQHLQEKKWCPVMMCTKTQSNLESPQANV